MWWLILGIFIGASVRLETSTGPCTLAEAGMVATALPVWAPYVILGLSMPLAVLAAWGLYQAQIAPQIATARAYEAAARRARQRVESAFRQPPNPNP